MPKYIELRPIKESPEEYEAIEREIKDAFYLEIYAPLMRELGIQKRAIKNSMRTPLLEAIASGRITYADGVFRGRLNAQITRELKEIGAKWDRRTSTFRLAASDMAPEYRIAVATSSVRFEERLASIDRLLSQKAPAEIAGKVRASQIFDATLWKVERDLRKTLSAITVPPELTDERRGRIAAEWQNNLDLWIKDFAEEEIIRLRKAVKKSILAGNRHESLVKAIQKSYGVTARKARFLARQETSLLMAKFKETRYADAGVTEYRWRCVIGSKLHPVRPSHQALNGKIFRFSDPPITTAPHEPPRRNNPGEDFNCRCFAIPIVRAREAAR